MPNWAFLLVFMLKKNPTFLLALMPMKNQVFFIGSNAKLGLFTGLNAYTYTMKK